jgi:hypothetical protein
MQKCFIKKTLFGHSYEVIIDSNSKPDLDPESGLNPD